MQRNSSNQVQEVVKQYYFDLAMLASVPNFLPFTVQMWRVNSWECNLHTLLQNWQTETNSKKLTY